MANRWFKQFTSSLIPKLCVVYGDVVTGASGAVSSYSGNGVYAVTKLTTGVYQIQLQDTFNYFVGGEFMLEAGVGSNGSVNDGSLVANTLYQIQTVGTTNWASVGLNSGLTPAVGQSFVATGSDGSGNGVVKAIATSGLMQIEVIQRPNTMLNVQSPGKGSIILFQCVNSSGTVASPVTGTKIRFELAFNNSFLTA